LLIGYARVSTNEQDLIAQRTALAALGVSPAAICAEDASSYILKMEDLPTLVVRPF